MKALLLLAGLGALARSPQEETTWHELRDGLSNSRAALSAGTARIAFLGGSITFNPGWRDQVSELLAARYPAAELRFVNAGIPSMGSTPGAFRFFRDVLGQGPVDLLFVEAAVNDSTNGRSELEMLRGMEGIVRQARRANPYVDVVLLHFADPDKLATIRAGDRPRVIAVHEEVARHYGVPSIDLAREVADRIEAGEFTWGDDFKSLHPSPFGQALYARSIERLLTAAWSDPSPAGRRAHELPAPLDQYGYDAAALVSIDAARLGRGFRRVASWRPDDGAGTRAGFVDVPALVAEEAGAELTLRFQGRAVGILVAAGPDAGRIAFQVDGGPVMERELFTPWSAGLHLPWAHVLAAELDSGAHELALFVLDEHDPRSTGNAVRILHVLVNGPGPG